MELECPRPTRPPCKRWLFHLESTDRERLRRLASSWSTSSAHLVRIAIKEFLNRAEQPDLPV